MDKNKKNKNILSLIAHLLNFYLQDLNIHIYKLYYSRRKCKFDAIKIDLLEPGEGRMNFYSRKTRLGKKDRFSAVYFQRKMRTRFDTA